MKKVYVIVQTDITDFYFEIATPYVTSDEQQARREYARRVKEARAYAEEAGWVIDEDDTSFSCYEDGCAAENSTDIILYDTELQ